jgi:hypothetical protein
LFAAFPYLVRFLYADVVTPTTAIALATAAGISTGTFARALLSNGLLAVQDDRFAARSLLVISALGLGGIAVSAALYGADGGLWAFAAAEFGFVLLAVARLSILWRRGAQ